VGWTVPTSSSPARSSDVGLAGLFVLSCPAHATSSAKPAVCGLHPSSSTTDGQWAPLGPLLPPLGGATRLTAGRSSLTTTAVIDWASVCGAGAAPARSHGAGKRANGRRRHLAVDTAGLLLAVMVTVAGSQDRDGACRLLAELRVRRARRAAPSAGAGELRG
jgi:hypothetical protein